MEPDEIETTFRQACGFAGLGMYSDAWDLLESLPRDGEVQLQPRVITARLIVCAGLKKWTMGLQLCEFAAATRDAELLEAMGRFYLRLAERLCVDGNLDGARGYITLMFVVWPDGRDPVLSSKALRPLFD